MRQPQPMVALISEGLRLGYGGGVRKERTLSKGARAQGARAHLELAGEGHDRGVDREQEGGDAEHLWQLGQVERGELVERLEVGVDGADDEDGEHGDEHAQHARDATLASTS